MKNDAIVFKNITKSYGEKNILKDFSLNIKKGEFLTIIGSSGCGKTTILKMINGLIKPNKGNVFVDGKDISKIINPDEKKNRLCSSRCWIISSYENKK